LSPFLEVLRQSAIFKTFIPDIHAEPWEHVIFFGIGAFGGNWFAQFEQRKTLEVEERIEAFQRANTRYPTNTN
jgi:hypothetical protein